MINISPGRKVVCLRDDWNVKYGETVPRAGGIYTVRAMLPGETVGWSRGEWFLHLYEIVNAPRQYTQRFAECAFHAQEFRPLDERATDISALTGLLAPRPVKELVTTPSQRLERLREIGAVKVLGGG